MTARLRGDKTLYALALAFLAAGSFLLLKLRSARQASRSGRAAAEQKLIHPEAR